MDVQKIEEQAAFRRRPAMRAAVVGRCLVAVLAAQLAAGQGRLRPPENASCGRDQLTVYSGKVHGYSRNERGLEFTIHTEEGAGERVELAGAQPSLTRRFLWNGAPFEARHWRELEVRPGRLRPGMGVNAWVCQGGAPPLLDWRPAPR